MLSLAISILGPIFVFSMRTERRLTRLEVLIDELGKSVIKALNGIKGG